MDRRYVIESKRYVDDDGNNTHDSWTSVVENIKIEDGFVKFTPTDGEHAGLKHYITFPNIHIVRECPESE
uniref:Uncharacterized protein n=1 Tax=Candidatus Methanogaster sp. ANME-2c ERB4 TaxID=2759911 RepID=A0A7G9YJ37_9EURY|nr:hypothetical protein BOHIEODL_00001 [Methanosarcinales archaeon ANME-2c ERB4]